MTENTLSTAVAAKHPAMKSQTVGIKSGLIDAMTPRSLDDAFRLAKALAMSGEMVPKHFQNRPEAVMAAMLQGASVGLAPMQALQFIAIINGRVSVFGDALPALILAHGHFVDTEVEGEGDKMVATATLTRKDGKKVVRTFSMSDAKKANLTGKPGPWQQYPARMLQMRARAWAVRDGAPDALLGLAIAEEVQDYGPDSARDVTPKAAPRPGRAVYLDPEPVIDAEPEQVALPAPDRDAFEGLANTIIEDAIGSDKVAVAAMYAAEIETMRTYWPDMAQRVEEALA